MPQIRKRDMDFLSDEITTWTQEKIINDAQASEILSLYTVKPASLKNLRAIMLTAGLLLFGLGAVSFLLAHWHQIDKVIRVCVISGAYLASLAAYVFTGRETGKKTGKFFLLLSGLIFGGGIYLITHMYDYALTVAEFLMYWTVELVIMSAITHDEWTMYLAQAVAFAWLQETDAINTMALYFVRTARVPVSEFFATWPAFLLVIALWLVWSVKKDRAAFMLNVIMTALLFASRMSLCFGGTWTLLVIAVTGAVMSFTNFADAQIMGLLMLGASGMLLTWPQFWRGEIFASYREILPVVNAVIVAGIMLLNIWRGHWGIGITFCVIIAGRYFFDGIFGYLPKAWGFTITGIIFVIAGMFFGLEKKIRRLFER